MCVLSDLRVELFPMWHGHFQLPPSLSPRRAGGEARAKKNLPPCAENVLPLSIHSATHRPQAGCSPDNNKKKKKDLLQCCMCKGYVRFQNKRQALFSIFIFLFTNLCRKQLNVLLQFNSASPCADTSHWSVGNSELINGLLQHPDTRAGLQISVSMCLLFDGWCFNILNLNRRRSAWWGLPHGYSGAQPGGPTEVG